ncbi:hypothetical protein PMG11_11076 [Penicillium brasilianum]|uniref:Uncharacterized protein n=1 Tax=Penicillium brasilianum TaxID=104259 RepID=A0A0F7U0X7_PENBI|nr:hypothetical protein PMG11_11076 [Penicillium brasilianum]
MIAPNEDRAFYGVPSDRLSPGLYESVGGLSQYTSAGKLCVTGSQAAREIGPISYSRLILSAINVECLTPPDFPSTMDK